MSLTNPNTVVTEERLSEFYQGILPYLGGMPEMLANKFSKGDIFSTEEKMIGQWIDGKPIYQKTFTGTFYPTTDGTYQAREIGTITNLDKVISNEGFYNTGDTYVSMPWTNSAGYMSKSTVVMSGTTGTVKLNSNNSGSSNKTAYVVIKYTKTTDSSTAIGNETDYSTAEKIVGTWIDGKPIYQKTITGQLFPLSSWNTTIESNYFCNYTHNISNIDYIIDVSGFAYWSGDNTRYTIMGNNCDTRMDCTKTLLKLLIPKTGIVSPYTDYASAIYNITIQYTKTT